MRAAKVSVGPPLVRCHFALEVPVVIPGLRGISIKEFGKRLFNEFNDDDVLGTAAQLSSY